MQYDCQCIFVNSTDHEVLFGTTLRLFKKTSSVGDMGKEVTIWLIFYA